MLNEMQGYYLALSSDLLPIFSVLQAWKYKTIFKMLIFQVGSLDMRGKILGWCDLTTLLYYVLYFSSNNRNILVQVLI